MFDHYNNLLILLFIFFSKFSVSEINAKIIIIINDDDKKNANFFNFPFWEVLFFLADNW
jgi:hypothetical protein